MVKYFDDKYVRCNGELELLSGDGEEGEGMEKPFYCKCSKCGELNFYTEEQANLGCYIIIDKRLNQLKVSKDNTIIIKILKNNWNIDELGEILLKCTKDYGVHLSNCLRNPKAFDIKKWIEVNL